VTFTDRLGSDIQIAPTQTDISAPEFALLFFDKWYCENGLPLEIISDRDKLFVSKFWKALHDLTGTKLKLSTSFHPETDGASERTNKTVNQLICYHVARNQMGWVCALPCVRFNMMNTVNASTGFSGFQLRMGRSPRIVPPLVADTSQRPLTDEEDTAQEIVKRLESDIAEAQDNLLAAKFSQTNQANKTRGPTPDYQVGQRVKLSTGNRRTQYLRAGTGRCAKFMPRFDGPYIITKVHKECSTVTLDLPNQPNIFPVFHTSELEPYVENNPELFPARNLPRPGPIVTANGQEEWTVEEIIDERPHGKGRQYLV
jgi:hypothetical protein